MSKDRASIKILIAEDQATVRDGLRKFLEGVNDFTIVGEASNGVECVKMLAKLKPDILLLDPQMPEKDGLGVLEECNFDSTSTRVIVLTAAKDDRDVVRAMRLGARGVVLKQSASELLVKSIRKVYDGEIWLDNRMTAKKVDAFQKSSESGQRRDKSLLSDREKEVVQMVAHGFRNREIGDKLSLSQQTVKNHLGKIFDKLGVSDRLELALYAIHHLLIDQPYRSSVAPGKCGGSADDHRLAERQGRFPQSLVADTTYGNGELFTWLEELGVPPNIRG